MTKRRFFQIRVAILLFVLFVVILYAIRDVRSRRARNAWERTLDVAVVLVEVEGRGRLDPGAGVALQDRLVALEDRLRAEAERHGMRTAKPFRFRLFGPVVAGAAPPRPAGDGALDLAKQAALLDRWVANVDPRAGVVPDHWDTRIYVVARPPASETRNVVEGESQEGGRIGIVDVELDARMADLTLFVVAHELLHTLGASDKYDEAGRVREPDGLVEPERAPLYPQPFAEVMARNRPVTRDREVVPVSLDELGVGPATAPTTSRFIETAASLRRRGTSSIPIDCCLAYPPSSARERPAAARARCVSAPAAVVASTTRARASAAWWTR